ncbi:MAG: hypothetical protein K2X53_05835 [Alphaproteobacteria bacterium]|nr:hypothetical protein [Alphaproteobacteria bacterium]
MGHTLNRKLLLTLTTLAYAFNASTLQASKLNDEESFSTRALSKVKTGVYGATGFVASATIYELERERFLHAKNQAVHYGCETGLFLADKVVKGYTFCSSLLNSAYSWSYDTYMPYHPTVCHVTEEAIRLGSEGLSALQQTVTDHPYVSAGVAVTFAASIGIAYLHGKNKASHVTKLMEEKEAAALKEKSRIEADNERLVKQLEELQSAQKQPQSPTSIVTQTHPRSSSDNKGTITSNPIVHGGQGGNVTLNIMMTPEMMKGGFSQTSSATGKPNTPKDIILIEE